MKRNLKIAALILMAGATTLASAQTPDRADRFADTYRQMQSQSSGAPAYANRTHAAVSSASRDALARESFEDRLARMQEDSSNSAGFDASSMLTARAARERESFAVTFARMQVVSSNSGDYGLGLRVDERATIATKPRIGRSVRGPV
jgi:hypothetical protein